MLADDVSSMSKQVATIWCVLYPIASKSGLKDS